MVKTWVPSVPVAGKFLLLLAIVTPSPLTSVQCRQIPGDGNVKVVAASGDPGKTGLFSELDDVGRSRLFSSHKFRSMTPKPKVPAGGQIFFNPATYFSGGVYGLDVSVGDFNGDGKTDLVVANECPQGACTTGVVSVLLNNGDGTFQSAQSYPSGGYEAFAVAVGDVNKDGISDLIVANGCEKANQCANGVVGVLLGNGDGTFQPAQSYSSGGVVASSVAIADVNKDGNTDLIVSNQCLDSSCQKGGVSVLLGKGNGKFQAPQSYASGGVTAMAVAVNDFNGDHKIDLVVTNQCKSNGNCNGSVGVLLGNGDGSFQPAQSYASGGYTAVSVVTGDFNGDRKIDLAVANQCQSHGKCAHGNVSILLGNGDGTFLPAQGFVSGGNNTAAVSAIDLSGDGRLDLVLANQCQVRGDCGEGSVSVLRGNGDGTFQAPQSYISDGVFGYALSTGDWNGDQKPDIVVLNQCQNSGNCNGTLTILLGNGDGTFRVPPSYPSAGFDADSVAIADLNGDGKPDLVETNLCQDSACTKTGLVSVLLGNGDGTFQNAGAFSTGAFGSSSVAVGDFNGDGKADVAVASQCSTSDCQSGGGISVLLGNGDGSLKAAQLYSSGAYTALSVGVADFNKDGFLDLVVANQCQDASCKNGAVSLLLGTGKGTFQPAQIFSSTGYYTSSVAIGDFNRDGSPDVAVASQCQDSGCTNGGVSVLLGNGDGTFKNAQSYSTLGSQADSVAIADVNGDGKLDLVVSSLCQSLTDCSSGLVRPFLGKGDGTFRGGAPISSGGSNAYSVTTGDFDGDGKADILVTNSDCTCLLLGNGDGTFQTASPYFPGGVFVAAGDINGDHQPDALVANGSLSTITILLNVAAGYRQQTTTTLASTPNPSAVNQSILFTATIATQFGGAPTGTVTFKSGTNTLGQGTVSNGQATLNYSFAAPGTNPVVATYSGDSAFLPSSSPPLKQAVTKALTTTALTSTPNPSQVGQPVKFVATVTAQFGGTPSGSVTFKDGSTVIAQVALTGGVAQYNTSSLTKGKHHILANYSGDSNFRISQGSLFQVVQ
jgi:hypothetical protein